MNKKEKKCFHVKEISGRHVCQITNYSCPFNGVYHLLYDEHGNKDLINGERDGCEVCYAYNLGQDYAKFNRQQTKVFAVCAGDAEKFQEPDKFFSTKDKAFQYLKDLSKYYSWKEPVVRTSEERFNNRTVVEIDNKTFVIIEQDLL